MHTYRLLPLALTLISLSGYGASASKIGDAVRKSLAANEFVAHEWGTFTSLQGSDGDNQPGLHHGDESLPNFVHCPLGFGYSRCLSLVEPTANSPMATTQRMETPVIYFYANAPQKVNVSVDFPEGLITEWYPAASVSRPEPGQVTELRNGHMEWNTEVITTQNELPLVAPQEIWQAQREVDSNQVVVEGEPEQFIFYRGIGRFKTPFTTESHANGSVMLKNTDAENIPVVILLNFNGEQGGFKVITNLAANTTLTLSQDQLPQPTVPSAAYVQSIGLKLESHLIAAGLFPLEAQAMINTWKRSYFQTPGLRALYILPRSWTDKLVPIQFAPAPKDLERVFVGRNEIFLAKEEQNLLVNIRDSISAQIDPWTFDTAPLGRFAEPKLWRIRDLTQVPAEQEYIDQLIQRTFQP